MEVQNKGAYFKIDWKIKNFKEFIPKKGQLLSSPTFVIDTLCNSQWVLHLYPDGDDVGNGKCTALYLIRKSDDDHPEDITLNCQLSFLPPGSILPDLWNMAPYSWGTTNHTFQRGSRCGPQEFLEREKISLYLENDTLTVRCEVFQNNVDSSKSGGCVAISMIGTDKRSFDWIIKDFQDMQPCDKKSMSIKSASKEAFSMTMTLSMANETILMIDISPVDKRIKRGYCSLDIIKGSKTVFSGTNSVWFHEIKSENWSFPLGYKESPQEEQATSSLHLKCYLEFFLGVEFEKIENTYYGLSDLKSESCGIM